MTSLRNPGRVAGLLYLLITIAGPLRLMYIPKTLFVHGDPAATINNIASHQLLFRIGTLTDVVAGTLMIFLMLAFYQLFKDVDRNQAVLMVILGGPMTAIVSYFNAMNDAAVLLLIRGAGLLSVFEQTQRAALAMLFLNLHDQELMAAEILWGLWLFPLAILVYRSRFLPRFLGVWLAINGFAYLAISFTGFLLPQYQGKVFDLSSPALFGEMAIMLWLLIKGAQPQTPVHAAMSLSASS